MALTASARESIRAERDRVSRSRAPLCPSRRGVNFAEICFEAADGDPLLALSLAADLVEKFGSPVGITTRLQHGDKRGHRPRHSQGDVT